MIVLLLRWLLLFSGIGAAIWFAGTEPYGFLAGMGLMLAAGSQLR